MKRTEIINRIAETLHWIVPNAKSILFGSQAREDATEESDIDLLILVDGQKVSIEEEEAKTPFYFNVMREGISL